MAYVISKTDGSQLVIIQDGSVDTNVTSLTLIGKNVSSFGDAQNENFVKMLENFNNDTQPRSPLQGQIWFNSDDLVKRPLIFDGSSWRPLAVSLYATTTTDTLINATASPAIPYSASQPGDFWFNSATKQLYVITSTSSDKVLIGPDDVPGYGTTRFASTTMVDSQGITHPVIKILLNGETIGILSNVSFTTNSTDSQAGFSKVFRGLTFKNYSSSTRYTTSTNDVLLHGLHEQLDQSYVRRNVSEHIQENWYIDTGYSLRFGTQSQSGIYWSTTATSLDLISSGSVKLETAGGQLVFNGTSINASGTITLGSSTSSFDVVYAKKLSSGTITNAAVLEGMWKLTTGSNFVAEIDLSNSLGTPSHRFNTLYSTKLSAGDTTKEGLLEGIWHISPLSQILPATDFASDLGSSLKRFNTAFLGTLTASKITGSPIFGGNVIPEISDSFTLGSTNQRWNSVHANNVMASSMTVTAGSISTGSFNTVNASIVKSSEFIDGNNRSINTFDVDGSLTANSDSRISTQKAVKTYVDYTAQSLSNLINSSISNVPKIPSGTVFYHAGVNAPAGYLVCNGAQYQTVQYPELFAAIGYTFGGGGGAFAVPDLRGMFVRGYDAGRGVDSGRAFGSYQADAFKSHGHLFDDIRWAEIDGAYSYNDPMLGTIAVGPGAGSNRGTDYDNGVHFTRHGTYLTGDSETRPKNIALLPIIKI